MKVLNFHEIVHLDKNKIMDDETRAGRVNFNNDINDSDSDDYQPQTGGGE